MDKKFRATCGTLRTFLCGLCLSGAAFGQTLPDGKGKAEFVHNCTACHTAKMVTRLNKTPEEWRKTVDDMAARGTDGTKEDLDNVVLYLIANFGADKPGPAAEPTPSSVSAGSAVLNPSEIERVKRIIAESGYLLPRGWKSTEGRPVVVSAVRLQSIDPHYRQAHKQH